MKTGIKTKRFIAYTNDKPTFKQLNKTGVYFIFNKKGELQYIGYSATCIYKAMYRHFQSWSDRRQQRFTYPRNSLVRLILTTPKRAQELEKYLILKMQPPDGLQKYTAYTKHESKQAENVLNSLEIDNSILEPTPF